MTQHQNSNDPWLAPYGTPPAAQTQPQAPYGAIEDAVGTTAWQNPYTATAPLAVGTSPWPAPSAAPTSMPVAPLYSHPVEGDLPLRWAGAPQHQGQPDTLDQAWYGIGVVDAVARAYRKTFRFTGRASRGEYWWFALYLFVLSIALGAVVAILATAAGTDPETLSLLFSFVTVVHIPVGLSLTVRRLHDSGNSGWLCLMCLIPWVGGLIVTGLCCLSPAASGDRYEPGAAQPYPYQPYVGPVV